MLKTSFASLCKSRTLSEYESSQFSSLWLFVQLWKEGFLYERILGPAQDPTHPLLTSGLPPTTHVGQTSLFAFVCITQNPTVPPMCSVFETLNPEEDPRTSHRLRAGGFGANQPLSPCRNQFFVPPTALCLSPLYDPFGQRGSEILKKWRRKYFCQLYWGDKSFGPQTSPRLN